MKRRTYLASTGVLAFAGCSGRLAEKTPEPTPTERPDQDYDGIPDAEDDYPDNYVAAETVIDVSERVEISPADFTAYPIQAERDGMIKYDILSEGGSIDVLFLDREDYDKWQKGDEDAEYRVVLSNINTASASTAQLLSAGEWVLVLDHTEARTLPNEQEVTVNITLEVAIESDEKPTVSDD